MASDYVGELHLDDFDLRTRDFTDENGCTVNALTEGTTWGNAESLTAVLASLMRDGDRVVGTRYGNRKPVVNIEIAGPDLGAVAATERDLALRVGRPAELRWKSDYFSEVTVFDVVWSDLEHTMDVDAERRVCRYFTLTLSALPHARAAELTVTPAIVVPAGAPTKVTVDDGSSTSGWTGAIEGAVPSAGWSAGVSVASGVVRGSAGRAPGAALGTATLLVQRTGFFSTAGTRYVTIRIRPRVSGPGSVGRVRVHFDGSAEYSPVATTAAADG